jgi:RNA polymerase sigma-70 factor, ECF subfamily
MLATHDSPRSSTGRPRKVDLSPAASEVRAGVCRLGPELLSHAFGLSRCPHAAEELVQETMERALRYESQYRPGSNVRAWLHRILNNVFMTRCRRVRVERNALRAVSVDPCAWMTSDKEMAAPGLSPPVARALAAVPAHFREVVVLVDLEERSYKDAARKLRVPLGTVMSRLHRGRRALAEALAQGADGAEAPALRCA